MKKLIILLISFMMGMNAFTQSSDEEHVKYSPEFEFADGIFINFQQVKSNSPVPFARLITNYDHTNPDFYKNLLSERRISFFDANGIKHEVAINKIWGFSRNGVLYIRLSEGFSRITIVGQICHFVADITTYETHYYDPYYRNPYYYNPYMTHPRSTRNSEMKQFLLDFETGKVMDYDMKSVEVLLMKDPELHDEYMELRKRKKKQLKFFYIRKFNERNPLYLPVKKY